MWTAELVSRPRVLTPHFFSERCAALDAAASAQIVEALRGASLLNETGFLREDPRCAAHGNGAALFLGAEGGCGQSYSRAAFFG